MEEEKMIEKPPQLKHIDFINEYLDELELTLDKEISLISILLFKKLDKTNLSPEEKKIYLTTGLEMYLSSKNKVDKALCELFGEEKING